jgi:hypothetical protein
MTKTKKRVKLFFKKKSKKKKNKTIKKTNNTRKLDKTIYKKNDFNKQSYPNISLLKYRAIKMADNMVLVSSIKQPNPVKKMLMNEYRKRLKIMIKKNPKFKKKVKNIDKLSPTKLEKKYFEFLKLEK